MDIQYNYEDLFISGGHSLTIPTVNSPVTFSDSYRETETDDGTSMARSNSLIINPFQWFTLKGEHGASYSDPSLQQQWGGNVSLAFPSVLTLELKSLLSQTGSDHTPFSDDYFSNWIRNYALLIPQKTDPYPDRNESLSGAIGIPTQPVSANLSGSLTGTVSGESPTQQKNETSFSLSLPFVIASDSPRKVTITPGYTRKGSTTSSVTDHYGFTEDFDYLFKDFVNQSYLYAYVPWQEIYSPDVYSAFSSSTLDFSKAAYIPAFSLTVDRPFGSYLYDIFLPAKTTFTMNRKLTRSGDLITDTNTYSGKLTWTALNLFGSLGAYRSINLYESEEISNSFEIELVWDRDDLTTELLWIIQNYFVFDGKNDSQFSLDHRLERTSGDETGWSDSLELQWIWKSFPDFTRLTFLKALSDEAPHLKHTEDFSFTYDSSTTPSVARQFSITAGHKTGLVFADIGGLYAQIALGIGRTTEEVTLFAFQGGIELELSF